MTKDIFAQALEVYRLELVPGEDRSTETLRRILESCSRRRRLRPLIWAAVLTTCSGMAAASIRELAKVSFPVSEVPSRQAVALPVLLTPSAPGPTPALVVTDRMAELIPPPAPAPLSRTSLPARTTLPARREPARVTRAAISDLGGQRSLRSIGPPVPALSARPGLESRTALQAEGELLQRGRTAMVRGDLEGALSAVDEHLTSFPRGQLAEEREALRIQALVAEDRNPEARAALGVFQRAYPTSLAIPALDEAVLGLTLPRLNDGTR